jgi:IclR family transcriptional regulator, KDG regulon repressor
MARIQHGELSFANRKNGVITSASNREAQVAVRGKSRAASIRTPRARLRVAAIRDIADGAGSRARGGVQSIGRAFAILEEIARNRDGIGLAELSKRVGLHNSTTFHLVKTMVSLGYVRQLKDSKRYRIGRPLFALAANALDEVEMMSLATPVLEDLSRETGESAHFSVRMGDAVVVLARTGGQGAFQLTDRVGVVRPAHCTALGKIILSALSSEQFERFLQRADLKARTANSITSAERLRREVAEVRRVGMAFDDGEFDSELRCVALPVRDFSGQVTGAIGISGPVWRLSIEALQKRARIVRAAADRLSREFGFAGEPEPRVKAVV